MKRILFRADAAPDIGTGDLVSFFTLAGRFQALGWEPWFMARDTDAARAVTRARGLVNVLWLEADMSVEAEVGRINIALQELGAGALFTQITRHQLQPYAGVRGDVLRCAVTFRKGLPADWDMALCWDVDPSPFFESADYSAMTRFLGPEYVILGPEFDTARHAPASAPTRKVLVAMGGGDEADLSRRVLVRLGELGSPLEVRIVVGGGYRHQKSLHKAADASGLGVTILQNIPSLLPEYLDCDLAFGAGGLTSSELAITRTPALLIAAVEHQRQRCEYFHKAGLARYLGPEHHWSLEPDDLNFRPAQADFQSRIQQVVDWVDANAAAKPGDPQ